MRRFALNPWLNADEEGRANNISLYNFTCIKLNLPFLLVNFIMLNDFILSKKFFIAAKTWILRDFFSWIYSLKCLFAEFWFQSNRFNLCPSYCHELLCLWQCLWGFNFLFVFYFPLILLQLLSEYQIRACMTPELPDMTQRIKVRHIIFSHEVSNYKAGTSWNPFQAIQYTVKIWM